MKYAQMLAEQMQKHGGTAWLINTGEMKGWGRNHCKLLSAVQHTIENWRTNACLLADKGICYRYLSSACV